MLYQESDLYVIVSGERTVAEGLGAQWVDGHGIKATRRGQVDEIWNHPKDMVLPFPFTVEQFKAFCDWHPTFEWEAIQAPFTNDDDTPDDAALVELAARGTDAAELVRHMLRGLNDKANSETAKKEKNGTTTRWTHEELQRLKEYRSTHTEDATAQQFGVSGTLVRRHLAKMKEGKTPKPARVWDGLGKR